MFAGLRLAWARPFPIGKLCALLTVLLAALAIVLRVETEARLLPTNHIDGHFQTASSLHRLTQGDVPGRDFFPYLGIGMVYVPYPLFAVAGKTLSAAVFSAELLVQFAAWLTLAFYSRLWFRRAGWSVSATIGSLVYLFVYFRLGPSWLDRIADRFLTPETSLRPLRWFAAILAAAVFLWARQRIVAGASAVLLHFAVGASAGALLLWSTDTGPVAALALLFFWIATTIRHRVTVSAFLVPVATALFVAMLLAWLASAGHASSIWAYAQDVSRDQSWFFGPWDRQSRVFTFTDALSLLIKPGLAGFLPLCGWLTYRGYRHGDNRDLAMALAGTVLFVSAVCLSLVGHYTSAYFAGLMVWTPFALAIVLRLDESGERFWDTRWARGLALVSVLTFTAFVGSEVLAFLNARRAAQETHFHVPELGGLLPKSFLSYVRRCREFRGNQQAFVEEYWGICSAVAAPGLRLPNDSWIHALGRKRASYLATLAALRPSFVITSRPDFTMWFSWSMGANWWLMNSLYREFEPWEASPTTLIWKRRLAPSHSGKALACAVVGHSVLDVQGELPPRSLIEIQFSYHRGPAPAFLFRPPLVMARTNVNFALSDGWLSLDPDATSATIPWIPEGGSSIIPLKTVPEGMPLVATACSARVVAALNSRGHPRAFRWAD